MTIKPFPIIYYRGTTKYLHQPHDNRSVKDFLQCPENFDTYQHQPRWVRVEIEKAVATMGLVGRQTPNPKRIFGLLKILDTISPETVGYRMNKNRVEDSYYTERYINAMSEVCRRASLFIEEARDNRDPRPYTPAEFKILEHIAKTGTAVELEAYENTLKAYYASLPF